MTLVLILFLALTASWTGPVLCEDEVMVETENISEGFISEESTPIAETNAEDPESPVNAGSGDGATQGADNADQDSTASPEITVNSEKNDEKMTDEKGTDTDYLQKVIIISLVLTLIIIPVIVCGVVIYCRRRTKVVDENEDHYLDNEDDEKVPMPMFEDDIPSVMELEMEDLENWMSKGTSGSHYSRHAWKCGSDQAGDEEALYFLSYTCSLSLSPPGNIRGNGKGAHAVFAAPS